MEFVRGLADGKDSPAADRPVDVVRHSIELTEVVQTTMITASEKSFVIAVPESSAKGLMMDVAKDLSGRLPDMAEVFQTYFRDSTEDGVFEFLQGLMGAENPEEYMNDYIRHALAKNNVSNALE